MSSILPQQWRRRLFDIPFADKDRIPPTLRRAINTVWTGETPWPLVILGEAGAGKTVASLLMLEHATDTLHCVGCVYTTVAEWCERVADAMYGKLRSESGYAISRDEVWKDWTYAPVAVLDELGTRAVSDHQYECVKKCLETRYARPTVYIANVRSLTVFADVIYDDRIASRLNAGTVVVVSGDQRKGVKIREDVTA